MEIKKILEKIENEGLLSLSDEEKNYIKYYCKNFNNDEIDDLEFTLNVHQKSSSISRLSKRFNIGDRLMLCVGVGLGNIPQYAKDFLLSNDEFYVNRINDKGKIDIGCNFITEYGKKRVFYYTTNKFEKIEDEPEIEE